MKIAFSLSDSVGQRLKGMAAEVSNGNVSLLVDLALTRLFELPPAELKQAAWRFSHDRRAATREDWMATYWAVLGEALGQPDQIGNPYAPRNFGHFYAVLLLNHVARYDDENDPFIPYIGPRISTQENQTIRQWHFDRSESPVVAAEAVASVIKELNARLDTKKG
ncbi:hypothetical protein EPN44_08940 [bacterium]|nr:MAG: hypothetical protein EPN44_08940 [bacterium]